MFIATTHTHTLIHDQVSDVHSHHTHTLTHTHTHTHITRRLMFVGTKELLAEDSGIVGDPLPYSYVLNFLFSQAPSVMKSPHKVSQSVSLSLSLSLSLYGVGRLKDNDSNLMVWTSGLNREGGLSDLNRLVFLYQDVNLFNSSLTFHLYRSKDGLRRNTPTGWTAIVQRVTD